MDGMHIMELRSKNEKKSAIPFHLVNSIKLDKPYQVGKCTSSLDFEPSIVNSSSETGTKPLFKCDLCDKYLARMDSLRRHKEIHEPNRLKCKFCSEKFSSYRKLQTHISIHGKKPYKCKSCDQTFGTSMAREIHFKEFHTQKDKIYTCTHCPANFRHMSFLLRHELVHVSTSDRKLDTRFFQCPKCDKTFTRGGHQHDHLLLHENPNQFACSICTKLFTRGCDLKRHMLLHNKERKLSCHFCQKKFTRFDALNVHIRIHTGEKPYKCKYCSKTFLQMCNLQDHERSSCKGVEELREAKKSPVINLPAPFQCSICMNVFKNNKNLKVHVSRVHKGERPFNCNFCFKKLASKQSLDDHIRAIHTKEQVYPCNLCEKKYGDKQSLESHVRNVHTKEKPYECNLCGKTFPIQSYLRRHSVSSRCHKNKNKRKSTSATIKSNKQKLAYNYVL